MTIHVQHSHESVKEAFKSSLFFIILLLFEMDFSFILSLPFIFLFFQLTLMLCCVFRKKKIHDSSVNIGEKNHLTCVWKQAVKNWNVEKLEEKLLFHFVNKCNHLMFFCFYFIRNSSVCTNVYIVVNEKKHNNNSNKDDYFVGFEFLFLKIDFNFNSFMYLKEKL